MRKFWGIIPVAPFLVAVDQCAACIAALRAELPQTFITLDHWHLNQNHLRNVANWEGKTGRQDMCKRLSQNLFSMRKRDTESDFMQLRAVTYNTFFHDLSISLPRWYKFRYHENPDLVVLFYRNKYSPIQFWFQGSGYTELSNSQYNVHFIKVNVRLCDVKSVVLQITERRKEDRGLIHRNTMNIINKKLQYATLHMNMAEGQTLLTTYTSYVI